jgi:lipopolysaccharide transport system ATP-binding protein
MSSENIAIKVEGISKCYRIGLKEQVHDSVGGAILDFIKNPLKNYRKYRSLYNFSDIKKNNSFVDSEDVIWALRDVSFTVKKGELLGIIGRNGAGKSTLLKILAKITDPTKGRVEIRGRVSSLLEVGTGFHPELTGRENIYLNATILGMRKTEIDRKFDEIVDFSGVEKFIDTPVKRYSSGMRVRVAFAVAAYLEPEILIIDEVLAVGDEEFQKKCLGKMEDVAKKGRTVLFVSHNLAAVQTLCSRGILLRSGSVVADDTAKEIVGIYLSTIERRAEQDLSKRKDRKGKGFVQVTQIQIFISKDHPESVLATGRPAHFLFYFNGIQPGMICTFTIYTQNGHAVANFRSTAHGPGDSYDPTSEPRMLCKIDELLLVPGRYRINVGVAVRNEMHDHIEAAALFDVEGGDVGGRQVSSGNRFGNIHLPHHWILPNEMRRSVQ